jgi:hypothetical protein
VKRKAILIQASSVKGHVDLPGARADQAKMNYWLQTSEGGAWDKDEITLLNSPSKVLLEGHLADGAKADYLFIAFSGHGEHVKDGYRDLTMVQINDYSQYSVQTMNKGAQRALIIADSCRHVRTELRMSTAMEGYAKKFAEDRQRPKHREMFDRHVMYADPGTIYAFGCSLNQAATDHPNGGAFTFSLVEAAEAWYRTARSPHVLTFDKVFETAKAAVQKIERTQVPCLEGSLRRNHFFPFSVQP